MEDKGAGIRFTADKARVLDKADLSRKGSVDEHIRQLVDFINAQESFYTTSSCSGRIFIFSEGSEQHKKGCKWLLVSHDQINQSQLISSLTSSTEQKPNHPSGYVFFKFEPFIVHMMCKTMSHAQRMLQVAVGSGFRNSGITCGKKGKIMLAIRSTHSLEVPVMYGGQLIVNQEYLQHLVKLGNDKLKENWERTKRFQLDLRRAIELSVKSKPSHQAPLRLTTSSPLPPSQHSSPSHSTQSPHHQVDDDDFEIELLFS